MEQRTENNLVIVEPKKSGRGQYERKARGSYKNDKRITIKLFQNKRLHPFDDGEYNYYKLYIQVSLKSQTTFFPVSTDGGEFHDFKENHGEIDFEMPEYERLDLKKDFILNLIKILNPFERNDFKISEIALICTSLHSPLYAVLNKVVATGFRMIYDKEAERIKILDWDLMTQILLGLGNDPKISSKINQEFWFIEEYCRLINKKLCIQQFYESGRIGLYENIDLTLLGYLKGDFQKHLINEIGEEKANRIFTSIDFILETYFCKQIQGIKNLLNKFW